MQALAKTTPEKPPILNKKTKAPANNIGKEFGTVPHHIVATQLKTFTAVGTAIIIVEALKYALVSLSNPTVNI
jgi:hypothetical protein